MKKDGGCSRNIYATSGRKTEEAIEKDLLKKFGDIKLRIVNINNGFFISWEKSCTLQEHKQINDYIHKRWGV